jgi:hypothetical protein
MSRDGKSAVRRLGIDRRRFTQLLFASCGAGLVPSVAMGDYVESGSVTIEQVQIAFIGSGNLGGGTLLFGGRQYDFTVGGLGVGGIGISKMEARGTVYNLRDLADFSGGYFQARYGLAIGQLSSGELWLENPRRVAIYLKAKREGLALSLGGDAVYIKLD